eukprot:gene5636-7014_t
MIREFKKDIDEDKVVNIFLKASFIAHDFISADFWRNRIEFVKSKYYTYIDNFIAALFVSPDHQGKGIGSQLIDHVKKELMGDELSLAVFEKNLNAILFYKKLGFSVTSSKLYENTGELAREKHPSIQDRTPICSPFLRTAKELWSKMVIKFSKKE